MSEFTAFWPIMSANALLFLDMRRKILRLYNSFTTFASVMMQRLLHIKEWINSHYGTSVGCTIALLALWQLVAATFGVDLCDSGYYLTFFENIFKAPASVEYNFMYYLSGITGGVLDALLPEGGKWMWMRVAGVLCNVGCMAILARAFRRILPATAVILGFVAVIASLWWFPYTFNNDLMSVLLWVAALALTFKGLTDGRWLHLLLAGLLVGVNIFTRIPNVLAVGLAVMPFIAHFYNKESWRDCWRQCGTLLLGMAVGVIAVIGLMMALGHWEFFKQNMSDLVDVATGSSGTASHNAGGMVMEMLRFYGQCLIVGLKAFGLWLAFWVIRRYVKYDWLRWPAWLVIAAVVVYFMSHQSHIMHPLWVMCVAGLLWVIAKGGKRGLAAWLGLFMLLAFPWGSDGATNNGGIIAWMAAPVAMLFWQRREHVIFPLAFILVGLYQTWSMGAYFDGGPLWQKTAAINDSRAALIHTTPERAQIINETLPQLRQFVNEGDTLLCYGSIPMMNHLTRTVPAIGCSWPELLSADVLVKRLGKLDIRCFERSSSPAILRQKFNNLGPYWSEATDEYLETYTMQDDKFLQQDKMDALKHFMDIRKYRLVWQNKWFALYMAD